MQTAPGTVVIHGTAADAAGKPIDLGQLEQRLIVTGDANFALNGRRALLAPGDGTIAYDAPGSTKWTATYTGLTVNDVTRALRAESRILWLGRDPIAGNELTIYENGPEVAGGPATPDCTAPLEPTAPQSSIAPANVAFGEVLLNTTSATRTVTFSSGGSVPVTFLAAPYIAGANAPEAFRVAATTSPAPGATLAAGASCTVSVTFAPSASPGARTESLNFATNSANDGFQSVGLTATGFDPSAPTVIAPAHALSAGASLTIGATAAASTVPLTLSWTSTGGATTFELQESRAGGAFTTVSTTDVPSATLNLALGANTAYQYRIRAGKALPDGTMAWSAYATAARFTLAPADDGANVVSFGGTWTRQAVAGTYNNGVRFASTSRDKAQLRQAFNAVGNVALIATTGRNRGRASISVDGGAAQTIDLYSPTEAKAKLVWISDRLAAGSDHQVVVQVLGTRNAASTGTRVDLDGFVMLR